jgi:drug/metabolite transporter (DMT)-like permease
MVVAFFIICMSKFSSSPMVGVGCGFGSAVCWGFTAALDDDAGFPWNGLWNAMAAIFAAAAVGVFIPKEACVPAPPYRIARYVCSFYPHAPPQPEEQLRSYFE